MTMTDSGVVIRECLIRKWPDFQGYGFNLHAEKGKAGQFIGAVDASSPAEAGGLLEGDRIVEVNGVNIGNENHQQVVTRIKAGGDETKLLVVDKKTDEYYRNNKIVIQSHLVEGIQSIECPKTRSPEENSIAEAEEPDNDYEVPDTQPVEEQEMPREPVTVNGNAVKHIETVDQADETKTIPVSDEELPPPPPPLTDEEVREVDAPTPDQLEETQSASDTPAAEQPVEITEPVQADDVVEIPSADSDEHAESEPDAQEPQVEERADTPPPAGEPEVTEPEPEPTPEPTPAPAPEPIAKPVEPALAAVETPQENGSSDKKDDLPDTKKLTAAEMREMLKKKKKTDPRSEKLSATDKLKMFQRM